MRCLDEFLQGSHVKRIISVCRESRSVQGILVEIHPRWMQAWRLGERFNPNDPAEGFKHALAEGYLPDLFFYYRTGIPFPAPWLPFRPITEKDLQWRPDNWLSLERSAVYSAWPVVMRICLYPQGDKDRGAAPVFREEGFRISYEVRPIARLYAGPKDQHRPVMGGVSIGVNQTDAGTMGGILKDSKGNYFGLTCAHVVGSITNVEQPAQIDRKGTVIGDVIKKELPLPFPSHAQKVDAVQKNYAAKVDAALVELHPGSASPKLEVLKMGKITDLVELKDIAQEEELELTGRTSGWQKVQKSSVVPFYNVTNKITNDEYCFENALIFREPSGGAAAQPGDSGAWVCKEVGTDYHWAAMVVGGDKQLGVAVAAHELKRWWEGAGYKLSVC